MTILGECKSEPAIEEKKDNSTALIIVIVILALIIIALIILLLLRRYKKEQTKSQVVSKSSKQDKVNKKANLEEIPISILNDISDDYRPESPPLPTQTFQVNDDGLKINLESIYQRKKLYESILESYDGNNIGRGNSEAG